MTHFLILLHIHGVFIVVVLHKSLGVDKEELSSQKQDQVCVITHNICWANHWECWLINIKGAFWDLHPTLPLTMEGSMQATKSLTYPHVENSLTCIPPSTVEGGRGYKKKITSNLLYSTVEEGVTRILLSTIEGRVQANNSNPPMSNCRGVFGSHPTLYSRGEWRMRTNITSNPPLQ